MKTAPMNTRHTGDATTMSPLSEVATLLYGFILAEATLKKQSKSGDGKIFRPTTR